ncbi:MAG: acyltransferase [Acidobacteria bacterium]|nr:acyltransferase [Acidobacteriota bacterium]
MKKLLRARVPVPGAVKPILRALYELWIIGRIASRRVYVMFIAEPLFRARCVEAGEGLEMCSLPVIQGHTEIHIGEGVTFTGELRIHSGRFFDHPQLVIKDRAIVGAGTRVIANKEVVIEEDVIIAPNCRLSDCDGHPREAHLRAKGEPPNANRDIRPVRICRSAWVGTGSCVMKGVTIGEGAIIGANSVVITDIPPYCLAMGNPAEVYFHNVGRPPKGTVAADGK